MRKRGYSILLVAAFLVLSFSVRAGENIKSGPPVGTLIPGSFDPFNINGKHKGRQHCLVCKHGLNPVVMIFVREPAEAIIEALNELIGQLDDAIEKHQDNDFLAGFVVYLSPDARSSVTEDKIEDADKLVKEAMGRDALTKQLETRAEKLKNVVLTYYPAEGPKGYNPREKIDLAVGGGAGRAALICSGYNLHEKAEVTVVYYHRYKVLANHAFPEGKMTKENAGEIIADVILKLAEAKKKPPPKKK